MKTLGRSSPLRSMSRIFLMFMLVAAVFSSRARNTMPMDGYFSRSASCTRRAWSLRTHGTNTLYVFERRFRMMFTAVATTAFFPVALL